MKKTMHYVQPVELSAISGDDPDFLCANAVCGDAVVMDWATSNWLVVTCPFCLDFKPGEIPGTSAELWDDAAVLRLLNISGRQLRRLIKRTEVRGVKPAWRGKHRSRRWRTDEIERWYGRVCDG